MNETDILAILLKNTYTKPDLLRRVTLLREYLESQFFSGDTKPLIQFLKEKSASLYDCQAIKAWESKVIPCFTPENFTTLMNHISKDIEKVKIITIYIPIEINIYEKEKMGKWLREKRGVQFLLEIHTDESRITGVAIAENSILRDYSLGYFLTKHREKIFDILNQYEPKTD